MPDGSSRECEPGAESVAASCISDKSRARTEGLAHVLLIRMAAASNVDWTTFIGIDPFSKGIGSRMNG
jgi:hypothetical protein